jgi:hypothetical protein
MKGLRTNFGMTLAENVGYNRMVENCDAFWQGDVLVERVVARSLLDAPEQAVELLLEAERRGGQRCGPHACMHATAHRVPE